MRTAANTGILRRCAIHSPAFGFGAVPCWVLPWPPAWLPLCPPGHAAMRRWRVGPASPPISTRSPRSGWVTTPATRPSPPTWPRPCGRMCRSGCWCATPKPKARPGLCCAAGDWTPTRCASSTMRGRRSSCAMRWCSGSMARGQPFVVDFRWTYYGWSNWCRRTFRGSQPRPESCARADGLDTGSLDRRLGDALGLATFRVGAGDRRRRCRGQWPGPADRQCRTVEQPQPGHGPGRDGARNAAPARHPQGDLAAPGPGPRHLAPRHHHRRLCRLGHRRPYRRVRAFCRRAHRAAGLGRRGRSAPAIRWRESTCSACRRTTTSWRPAATPMAGRCG